MGRKFKNPFIQKTYEHCMMHRPEDPVTCIDKAFFAGYENPEAIAKAPLCGAPSSPSRAAWAAGVDCRRADDKSKKKNAKKEVSSEVSPRERIINGFISEIKKRADSMEDGWIELTLEPEENTNQEVIKIKVPRIPFERWATGAINHRRNDWPNVCPSGIKMQMDDRNHSDWWLATGIPLEYAYGRKPYRGYLDYLEPDDEDYVSPDPKTEEYLSLAKRIISASWDYRWNMNSERDRNSIFLVSTKKEITGRIMHVRSPLEIMDFVDEAVRWKRASNSQLMIAVVPDCSVIYDPVIRHAGAIITEIGSAAAHLVKVAREDKIPVIMCPNAFEEFFEYEEINIKDKRIRSTI